MSSRSARLEADLFLLGGREGVIEVISRVSVEVRFKCIEEYKGSTDFENEIIKASSATFIQDFQNCKAHL